MRQIRTALEMYYNDHGDYPSPYMIGHGAGSDWETDMQADFVDNGYLSSIPKDPIYNDNYHYRYYSDWDTSYTCDGRLWNEWEWVIIFNLEGENDTLPENSYAHYDTCVHGGLK